MERQNFLTLLSMTIKNSAGICLELTKSDDAQKIIIDAYDEMTAGILAEFIGEAIPEALGLSGRKVLKVKYFLTGL